MNSVCFLIAGLFIGMAVQRFLFYIAAGTISPTICDYCQWKKENRWRWEKLKDRHK